MKTLAQRLIWARLQKGIRDMVDFTQDDLAEKAGVSQGSIGHLESGRTKTTRKLTVLAKILGVNSEWLGEGTGDIFPKEAALTFDDLSGSEAQLIMILRQMPKLPQKRVIEFANDVLDQYEHEKTEGVVEKFPEKLKKPAKAQNLTKKTG